MMIPEMVNITEAKVHDHYGLDQLIFPKDTIIVEDRGYFDFTFMLNRIASNNVFVTRIKENTVYESIEEYDLPDDRDQDILKDELIRLTSQKAKQTGISQKSLRLVSVYKADENEVIHIITNQLNWSARTIADLYKRRWDIELFFKALKQNLQVKTFIGTSENAVKSQIYIALISYLLLELINRTVSKTKGAFSNFVEKIRICLPFYQSLDYICNHVSEGAKKVTQVRKSAKTSDLFSSV